MSGELPRRLFFRMCAKGSYEDFQTVSELIKNYTETKANLHEGGYIFMFDGCGTYMHFSLSLQIV